MLSLSTPIDAVALFVTLFEVVERGVNRTRRFGGGVDGRVSAPDGGTLFGLG